MSYLFKQLNEDGTIATSDLSDDNSPALWVEQEIGGIISVGVQGGTPVSNGAYLSFNAEDLRAFLKGLRAELKSCE